MRIARPAVLALPLLLALPLVACGRSSPPSSTSDRRVPLPPASPDAGVAMTMPADPRPPAPLDAAALAATADAAPPQGRGDHCHTDTDCGWDDPCMATRCLGIEQPQTIKCEESAPRPGTCSCIENQCTLQPKDPTRGASAPGCTADDECALDVGAATCTLGGDTLIGPIDQQGPVCTCDPATTRCQWSYTGPIACKTWRDCSWLDAPRLRPAPSKLVPRPFPKPVRACKDGEIDSVCSDAKVCEIVAWKC